jgi:DNA-binding transcriptional LysR family regulator
VHDKQIRAFLAVVKRKSMTRAAIDLYISMPALKKHIDSLEEEIAVTLFQRTKRGCFLTDAGEAFYEGIKSILRDFENLLAHVRSLEVKFESLRVCTTQKTILPLLDKYCTELLRIYPYINIQYTAINSEEWFNSVRDEEADVCFLSQSASSIVKKMGLEYVLLNDYREIVCVMTESNPLAQNKRIAFSQMIDVNVLITPHLLYEGLDKVARMQNPRICINSNIDIEKLNRSDIFNVCTKNGVLLCIAPIDQQYSPLISVPLDYPAIDYGWAYRPKSSKAVYRLIEVSQKMVHFKGNSQ